MNKWYEEKGFQDDVVLSTRIRLARNINGLPFPTKMKNDDAKKAINIVSDALKGFNYKFKEYNFDKLDRAQLQSLLEEYQISPKMLEKSFDRAVHISLDNKVSIMVNEEDHIRMQCVFAGFETEKAFDLINKIDDYLSEKTDFAFSEKYGFLTSCLTNVGTGMRVSFMVHLPALVLSGAAQNMFSAIGKLGVAVRGVYGEGSEALGHLFQISNQITLGVSEKEILEKMNDVINQIINKERELRRTLIKENGLIVEDKVSRAYAILKHAKLMNSKELMETISYVRLGVSQGLIDDIDIQKLNKILIETRPAHVLNSKGKNLTFAQRDEHRANMIREILDKEE